MGVVLLGLASGFSSLEDSDSTVAVFTLIDDSSEVVEISGVGTKSIEVIDFTVIRGTEDVEDSLETTVVLDVFLGIEDHGTDVVTSSKETAGFISDDLTISIDLFEGHVNSGEYERAESEDAD